MSRLLFAAPGKFQPPVTQRHLEAEVPHCVGGVASPLLANIALSALDEHFCAKWDAHGSSGRRTAHRKRGGATYRIVRYADLCRARHKSAYADCRVMPRGRCFCW
jgi:RNA-directed DNA polymerase